MDISGYEGAEVAEGLKRVGPMEDAENGERTTEEPAGEHRESVPIDPEEVDRAVGKLWGVAWGIVARRMDADELREEEQDIRDAADALGPVFRKHLKKSLHRRGPEAVATIFLIDTADRKWNQYQRAVESSENTPSDG